MSQRKRATTVWKLAMVTVMMAAFSSSAIQADQIIADDLIVEGSACIGFDCENDQPFYFTTFALKENNLRIFFDDTSTTAAFPKRDWEILANDSANGGASFLGFADRGGGVISVSGQGFCEGGTNHGLVCGDQVGGANCNGICAGGLLDGLECSAFPGDPCSEYGGTCIDAGVCVPHGAIIFRIEAGGPEDSLVIDSLGHVHIAGDLTVEGTINGSTPEFEALQAEVDALQAEVDALQTEVDAIKSFPPIRGFLERH